MKTTAIAPSNIAFIKYWGKTDATLRIPTNGSISMNLSTLTTTTTVEFSELYKRDNILIDGDIDKQRYNRVAEHIDRFRKIAKTRMKAKVISINSFPSSTGLSSSASGFAALTLAVSSALGLDLSEKELTIMSRLACGSSCRSIPSGFVEWYAGNTHETSYAASLYPPTFWDIVDIVVIVSHRKKDIATSQGQTYAHSSPFFKQRLMHINEKIKQFKQALRLKNFHKFGEIIEQEALELHAIMLTGRPPLIYLSPESLVLIKRVWQWRNEGLSVYFTINTGHNIHLLCPQDEKKELLKRLKVIPGVLQIVKALPCQGAYLSKSHLF